MDPNPKNRPTQNTGNRQADLYSALIHAIDITYDAPQPPKYIELSFCNTPPKTIDNIRSQFPTAKASPNWLEYEEHGGAASGGLTIVWFTDLINDEDR